MNGKRLTQLIKSKLEKVNSLLTSGEDVLISDVHIIKTGHQVLPKKIWLPFIRKPNVYIQVPKAEAQGFALPGTAGPRLSRLHTHCLSGTTYHKFSTIFHSF